MRRERALTGPRPTLTIEHNSPLSLATGLGRLNIDLHFSLSETVLSTTGVPLSSLSRAFLATTL